MVGPYGEYVPLDAYFTLRAPVGEQEARSRNYGALERKHLSSTLNTPWSPLAASVADKFVRNLLQTQRSMAKAMGGATNNGDVLNLYPTLFDQIDGLFPKGAPEEKPAISPGG